MNKISIKGIKFKAFRSFRDQQSLEDLPDHGLYGIKGFNNNTGGSSGSGKTSFHIPITYAFGIAPYSATELQSWDTEEKMQVELHLDTYKGPAILKRGKEFSLTLNGIPVQGSAKAVEQAIRDLIGMDPELLEALTFRKQQSRGRFLSMTDSVKKEFLSKLLGLEQIEPLIAEAIKKANNSQIEAAQNKGMVDVMLPDLIEPQEPTLDSTKTIQNTITFLNDAITSKTVTVSSLSNEIALVQSKLGPIRNRVFTDTETTSSELDRLQKLLDSCNQHCKNKDLELAEKAKVIKEEISFQEKGLASIQKEANKLSGFEAKRDQLTALIAGLESQKCPTCDQSWLTKEDLLNKAKEDLRIVNIGIEASTYAKNAISSTTSQLQELKTSLATMNNQNEDLIKLKEIKTELLQKIEAEKSRIKESNYQKTIAFSQLKEKEIKEIERELDPTLEKYNTLKRAISELSNELRVSHSELANIEKMNKLHLQNYEDAKSRYNDLKRRIDIHQALYEKADKLYKEEADFAALLKSFLGAIFEEVLVEIANETNEMLRHIPNVATTVIQFSTENVTGKGTIRQEIKPVVLKNGVQVPLLSGLSGGQLTAVDLAVDLAIGKVAGRRVGITPNWLVLDECLDGLGVVEKESCLELLKLASRDRFIMVIDHASEAKEAFDRFILIESTNDVSTIKGID